MWHEFVAEAQLTEGQQAEVLAILFDAQKQNEELRKARLSWRGDKEEIKSLLSPEFQKSFNDEIRTRVAEVLSPEQMAAFDDWISPALSWASFDPIDAGS